MRRGWIAILAGALLLLGGCGGGGDDSPPTDREIASETLLTAQALPGEARELRGGTPASFCGAEPVLRIGRTASAESPTFSVDHLRARQAISVFPTTRQARRAFDSLHTEQRRDCILNAIKGFGPRRSINNEPIVDAMPILDLDYGDETKLMRFKVFRQGPGSIFIDALSVRVDRAVGVFVGLSRFPSELERFATEESEKTAQRMATAFQ